VLIAPTGRGVDRLGWAWAARLIAEDRAKIVRTTDLQWTLGKAKIRRFGGMSVPMQSSPIEAALRALYGS